MSTTVPQEFRKFLRHCYTLRIILKDTLKYLDEIRNNAIFTADLKNDLLKQDILLSLQHLFLDSYPAIVVFGQNCHSKAVFVNYLLDQPVLPVHSSCWKWVRLSYGHTKEIFLTLRQEYEIVEKLQAHEKPWTTVPEADILRSEQELPNDHCATLEIKLNSAFLKDKVNVVVPPDYSVDFLSDVLTKSLDNILPVIIYVVSDYILSDLHIREISKIKEAYQDLPILFFVVSDDTNVTTSDSLTESEQHSIENKVFILKNQLIRLGYLRDNENVNFGDPQMEHSLCAQMGSSNHIIGEYECKSKFARFLNCAFKSYLLSIASKLSRVHSHCLRKFILTAFDMAREIQITPQRIKYAQVSEGELYKNLMKIAVEKQEEITKIIHSTLQDMKLNIAEVLDGYCREYDGVHCPTPKMATMEIQQLVLNKLGSSIAGQLVQSVGCLHENYTGTLQRCIENLEKSCYDLEGNLLASDAVTQIITAAYSIELKSSTSLSLINSFMERLRKLLHRFQMPWTSCSHPEYDLEWQKQVVANMIDSLSSAKLAKNVSTQFQEIVKSSHDSFQSAMRLLENRLSGKLEQTEEQRVAIRKQYAPRFARLALESTSLCDLVRFGMPIQTREIGRGQYGVVFSCEPWGGVSPCAVKSVVPPDDRHWNDLAMEFYYTRTIPEHPRIVKLRGSVIDYQYGGGCASAVLLVMERMTRDLYCGLRSGLSWRTRLQIAIDVIEGIRYLHSQGLVHRDIKLKNVLLDNEDRAKLTDFGFCIPEAMMSGSIVGTPVHMAPELLSGHYDSSVDVYAFGILFWYICANQVGLPCVFEQFHNKEQLWTSVRKGVRPECLPQFSGECWTLMEQCWAAEPSLRPLLGNVQPRLEAIRRAAIVDTTVKPSSHNCSPPYQRHKVSYVESSIYDQFPLVQVREF